MEFQRNNIESDILGGGVYELSGFSHDAAYGPAESELLAGQAPAYLFCRVPLENLEDIHALESNGYRFIEVQLRLTSHVRRLKPLSILEQYEFTQVSSEAELEAVLEIASKTFVDDRFTVDPRMSSDFAKARYRAYLEKSHSADNEFLYKLVEKSTNRIVAFKSHTLSSATEARLYLGGVAEDLKGVGVGLVNAHCEFRVLRERGVRTLHTHVSARNYPIMNMEISALGFKVVQSTAFLRKLLP